MVRLRPRTSPRSAREAGHSWRTVQRAERDLGEIVAKTRLRGGWCWSLPSEELQKNAEDGQAGQLAIFGKAGPSSRKDGGASSRDRASNRRYGARSPMRGNGEELGRYAVLFGRLPAGFLWWFSGRFRWDLVLVTYDQGQRRGDLFQSAECSTVHRLVACGSAVLRPSWRSGLSPHVGNRRHSSRSELRGLREALRRRSGA